MAKRAVSVRARWLWAIGGLLVAGAVVATLVFQPWLLFIDVRVSDEIPAPASSTVSSSSPAPSSDPAAGSPAPAEQPDTGTPSAPPPAAPADLLSGTFVSHEHTTTGSVRVIEYPDGTRRLAIEGLETTNGPDVHVWLSAAPVIEGFDGWFTAAGYDYLDLGPIKGNLGDQLYDIPVDADLAALRTVELWCVQFSVSFGAAALA